MSEKVQLEAETMDVVDAVRATGIPVSQEEVEAKQKRDQTVSAMCGSKGPKVAHKQYRCVRNAGHDGLCWQGCAGGGGRVQWSSL